MSRNRSSMKFYYIKYFISRFCLKHFQEFIEDQFDFHSYCLRKVVLCAYVDMLNLEDHIKGHKFFRQAAQLAIEVIHTQT